nr:hypothetical protein [Aphanizomenon flos-aquae]
MSDTVIRVENLGKKYIIGHQQQERYTSLRDVITNKRLPNKKNVPKLMQKFSLCVLCASVVRFLG